MYLCYYSLQAVLPCSLIFNHITHLYMAPTAIAKVSKVKGHGVWSHSSLYYKAEVCFMPAPRPSHVLVMVDELFPGQ